MSTYDFCKSMTIYPIQQSKKRRNNLPDCSLKSNKNACSNYDLNKEDSIKKKYVITISNNFYKKNKNYSDIKIPDLKFKDNINSKYKKITFFSVNVKKQLLDDNNRKKKIFQLNPFF